MKFIVASLMVLLVAGCAGLQQRDSALEMRPDITIETLDNGLTVYMLEDHSAPLVSYQVWFKVGSVNEYEAGPGQDHGITGLSHFFEHMMFRGTEKYPKFFDSIYAMGGKLNAFTWLDETVYWENMPSQHLHTVIDMEADRLENMTIDFVNLEPEREVVKSERMLRTENRPMGLAWERLQARAFTTHPYHWKTIGWMRDLNAITVEEAIAYHRTFYAPNNAYIIVSGDHDSATTLEVIKRAYGHLKPQPLPSDSFPEEPQQVIEKRDRVFKAQDAQMVLWGYRAMPPSDPDFAILEVLDRILTDGKASRLQKRLVHGDTPRLSQLFAYTMPIRHPYLYLMGATLLPDMTAAELETIVDQEVTRLATDGVSEAELARAVAKLRSDVVRENLSNQKKAEFIGFSIRTTDSPYTFFDRLVDYGKVTADDVRRVASALLRATNRTTVPVVDLKRYAALTDAIIADMAGLPTQVAAALKEAVAIKLEQTALAQKARALAERAEAVRRLGERATLALKASEGDAQDAIQTYLDENENGLKKRTERLNTDTAALAEARVALDARTQGHLSAVEALTRMKFDLAKPPNTMAMDVIRGLMGQGARRLALKGERSGAIAAMQPGLQVAYFTMMAWALDDAQRDTQAQQARERAIALYKGLSADDGAAKTAKAAFSLAWDTQVTGTQTRTSSDAATREAR